MGFVRPDLAPNGTKWSADGGHSGGQAYKTVGFWVGIMCGLGFIGLAVYWLYLKRHYERVAVERPRARATVARVAQKLEEVPTEVRTSAKGECSICLSRRAEFGAAGRRPAVQTRLPCEMSRERVRDESGAPVGRGRSHVPAVPSGRPRGAATAP